MEHHSNQTSWLETIADVVVVPCNEEGTICIQLLLKSTLKKMQIEKLK
jgi:selenocysteine lyase/cysteine desulfurase